MIIHEIINYHANYLFAVLREQVDAAMKDALATGLLRNNDKMNLELKAALVNPIWEKIRDKQADSTIGRAIRRTLE